MSPALFMNRCRVYPAAGDTQHSLLRNVCCCGRSGVQGTQITREIGERSNPTPQKQGMINVTLQHWRHFPELALRVSGFGVYDCHSVQAFTFKPSSGQPQNGWPACAVCTCIDSECSCLLLTVVGVAAKRLEILNGMPRRPKTAWVQASPPLPPSPPVYLRAGL